MLLRISKTLKHPFETTENLSLRLVGVVRGYDLGDFYSSDRGGRYRCIHMIHGNEHEMCFDNWKKNKRFLNLIVWFPNGKEIYEAVIDGDYDDKTRPFFPPK